MKRAWLTGLLAVLTHAGAADPAPAPPAPTTVTLGDLFAEEGVVDVSVSPSGRYVSAVIRHFDHDLLMVYDVTTGASKGLTRMRRKDVGDRYDARITDVVWKTEQRLLF